MELTRRDAIYSSGASGASDTAAQAEIQQEAWKKMLAFRITMQSSLDIINKLPVLNTDLQHKKLHVSSQRDTTDTLNRMLIDLNELLKAQLFVKPVDSSSNSRDAVKLLEDNKKRKLRQEQNQRKNRCDVDGNIDDSTVEWSSILDTQQRLKSEKWQPTVNKWHAKLYFGSEKTKSTMKVFNHSIWDQVREGQ